MSNKKRAQELMQDLAENNPELLTKLQTEGDPQEYLEQKLNSVDDKAAQILTVLIQRIPKGLDPLAYEQEVNWKRQQAIELANEEVRQMLR